MLAVSTQSLKRSSTDPDEFLGELLDLPTYSYEAGAGLWAEELQLLEAAVHKQRAHWSSLRCHCPRPTGLPPRAKPQQVLELASTDREQQQRAAHEALHSLQWAARLEAPFVILPVGRVDAGLQRVEWEERLSAGEWTPEYARAASRQLRDRRQRRVPAALDSLRRSLETLLNAADNMPVTLALENPSRLDAVLAPADLESLRHEFDGGKLSFWYSPAAARYQEQFFFETGARWQQAMGGEEHIAGLALSDVVALRPGGLPGRGEQDFAALARDLAADKPAVVTTRPAAADELAAALEHLRQAGFEGPPPTPWEEHLPRIGG